MNKPMTRLLGGLLIFPLALGLGALARAQQLQPLKPASEAQAPDSQPAASEIDPDGLAKYAPEQNLVVYLEFQGTQAHQAAWNASTASDILSQTKTGAMLKTLVSQIAEGPLSTIQGRKLNGPGMAELLSHALKSGFVFAFYGVSGQKPTGLVVVRDAFDPEIRPAVGQFLATSGMAKPGLKTVTKSGRNLVLDSKDPKSAWWIEGGKDLVIAEDFATILDVLDGKKPSAANDPIRQQLVKPEGEFEPLMVGFANLPENANIPQLSQAGLSGVRKLTLRWGPEGKRLKTVLHVSASAPRQGLLALIDQPTVSIDKLPPMPEGTSEFTALSLDPRKAYLALKDLAARGAHGASAFASLEEKLQTDLGMSLQDDILAQIGPRFVYYATSTEPTGLGALLGSLNPLARFQLPQFVIMAELKDPKKFAITLNETINYVNETLDPKEEDDDDKDEGGGGGDKDGPRPAQFRVLSPKPPTYMLSLPSDLSKVVSARLTVLLGEKYLIIAASPDLARAATALESKTEGIMDPSGPQFQGALDGLPGSLLMVRADNPSDSLPAALVSLPESLQTFIASLNAARQAPPPPNSNQPGAPGAGSSPLIAGAGSGVLGLRTQGGLTGLTVHPETDNPENPEAGLEENPEAGLENPEAGLDNPEGNAPGGKKKRKKAPPASPLASIRIQVPATQRPDPAKLRSYIQPGCLAVAVDPDGLTIIRRQSFPDLGTFAKGMAIGARGAVVRSRARTPNPEGPAGASPENPPSAPQ